MKRLKKSAAPCNIRDNGFFLSETCGSALRLLQRQFRLYANRALQSFFLDRAADFVRLADIAVEQIGVGMTAAAAKEPRPAVFALRLVQHMTLAEITRQFLIRHALKDRAKPVPFASDKLMARVQIAVGRHRVIFMARAAAG